MIVEILAADSMGARSMATCVEAGGHLFLIDPGVALGPLRYGLPPHRAEFEAKDRLWRRIEDRARSADFIIVTHYHHDHYNPDRPDIFFGKVVILKDWKRNINKNQAKRASLLLEQIRGKAKEIVVADGNELEIDGVKLIFSPAQPHGYSNRLGCVVQVLFSFGGKRFLFTSDIQGVCLREHADFIISATPDVVFMDGAPTYLLPTKFPKARLEEAFANLTCVMESLRDTTFVVDHHTTRDEHYRRWFELYKLDFKTAAEFMGFENMFLEAWRKKLYKDEVRFLGD